MSKETIQLTPQQTAAAVTSLGKNAALLAGAGCGKTFVLTHRLTNLLMENKNIEDILSHYIALTFTEKAAMEMSQRLRETIRSLTSLAGSDADRKIFVNWLIQLPEAKISTIHGFCASLLRRWAVEAGIDPAFSVCADEFIINTLLENSILQAITSAAENNCPALTRTMGENSLSLGKLQDALFKLIMQRDRVAFNDYLDASATLGRWQTSHDKLLAELPQKLKNDKQISAAIATLLDMRSSCTDPGDKLYIALDIVAKLSENIADLETIKFILNNTLGRGGSKKSWLNVGGTTPVRDAYKQLQKLLAPFEAFLDEIGPLDEKAAILLADLCKLAIDANKIFTAEKRNQGIIDFNDLIIATRDILAARPDLCQQLSKNIRQMLIDEAQDTDRQQIDMLLSLLRNPDGNIDDGKLFLVGDAKQSIYRFRGAQLEVFTELCDSLGKANQLPLDKSFRTIRPVVDFVNYIFNELMPNYQPIDTIRNLPDNTSHAPAVELLLADDTTPIEHAAEAIQSQAKLTAQRINEMVANKENLIWDNATQKYRPVQYGDIAVLFSRMTGSLEYERELQNRDIPYYVLGGTGFYRRQEIFDLLNALRIIDDPADDIAFTGLLKSAMVGLDDNAIMHIAQNSNKPMLTNINVDNLTEILQPNDLDALKYAIGWIKKLSACKDSLGTEKLLQEILLATSFEATLQSQFQGQRMIGNVRMLLDRAAGVAGELSLAEFIAQTTELTVQEFRAEQASTADESENVVRLLTIHKAKGLEYPVVIVPDLNHSLRPESSPLLSRLDWGLTTTLTADDNAKPTSASIARALENQDQYGEFIRKYYVALTRSRDHLILIGASYKDKNGSLQRKGSFIQTLDELLDVSGKLATNDHAVVKFGGVNVAIKKILPEPAKSGKKQKPVGQTMLSSAASLGDFENTISSTAKVSAPLPLLGRIPQKAAKIELATTALAEFEKCPALYHWRYELKAPLYLPAEHTENSSAAKPTLNPLTLGTLLHRCMELYDFKSPQKTDELAGRAMYEMEISGEAAIEVNALLENIIETFNANSLASQIANAGEIYRELDFVNDYGCLKLRGQIDLLYRIGEDWFVLDYKSDQANTTEAVDKKLAHYKLQLLIYSQAVARYTGKCPKSATLYFLRTGKLASLEIDDTIISAAESKIIDTATALIDARRSGKFERCNQDSCDFCRQQHLKHF